MRKYRLIFCHGEWMVCSKARRTDEEGGEILVWIYGNERIEFCRVGKEQYSWPLPLPEQTNFFNDRFNFAVDRKSVHLDQWDKCGGADSLIAARRAFEAFVKEETPHTQVRLRHGARIVAEETGTFQRISDKTPD